MKFFADFPGLTIAFSTRDEGSFTTLERVRQQLQPYNTHNVSMLHREHSDRVVNIDTETEAQSADSMITASPNILALPVADCYPIVIFDQKHHAVALIHAGWRPLMVNILLLTIQKLQLTYGSQTKDLQVWIGPGISADFFYESDQPIQHSLIKWRPFITQREDHQFHIDLSGYIMSELIGSGIPQSQIFQYQGCTFREKDVFFSHRRATLEGDEDGRIFIATWLH